MPRQSFLRVAVLLAAACTYDLDKIYEHDSDGAEVDAGRDAGEAPLPAQLIDLWKGPTAVSPDCAMCAKSECGDLNTSCRADESCARLTRCAATKTDPGTLDRCRSKEFDWLSEDPEARILGGPFYSCVFRVLCDEQCGAHTDASCVGKYNWSKSSTSSVSGTFQFVNALVLVNPDQDEPAANLSVKLCAGTDVDCIMMGSAAVTDADGKVALTLPTPVPFAVFGGYLDLTGEGWAPTLVQFGFPITRSNAFYVPIVKQASLDVLEQMSGVAVDPARGQLQLRMFGCSGVGMRRVSFSVREEQIDATTKTWYAPSEGPFPDFAAGSTSDLGSGGIINVKTGFADITAKRVSDGVVVAKARAPVRAGYLTIVVLAPLDSSQ